MADHVKVLKMLVECSGDYDFGDRTVAALEAAIAALTHPQPVTPAMVDSLKSTVDRMEELNARQDERERKLAKSVTPESGEVVARRFVGVGELERTGYIPAGSAAEREDRNNEGDEVVAYRYVADEGVYNPFVRDWLDGSPDQLDLENIARHPGVRFEFAYSNPLVPDHELQQKWFRAGWDMYVEIHGETHPPVADDSLVELIDEALEQMELHGMHALREYKELKARHRLMDAALNQRGDG